MAWTLERQGIYFADHNPDQPSENLVEVRNALSAEGLSLYPDDRACREF